MTKPGATTRAWNIVLGYDRLGNSTLGNDGRETISSRVGRCGPVWAERAINWVFYHMTGEQGHCKASIEPIGK